MHSALTCIKVLSNDQYRMVRNPVDRESVMLREEERVQKWCVVTSRPNGVSYVRYVTYLYACVGINA